MLEFDGFEGGEDGSVGLGGHFWGSTYLKGGRTGCAESLGIIVELWRHLVQFF